MLGEYCYFIGSCKIILENEKYRKYALSAQNPCEALAFRGGINVTTEEKKSWAVELLIEKNRELGRLPHKDDFDEVTRSRIKAFLGPWPRALETAGLKEPKSLVPKKTKKRKTKKKLV